MSVIFLFVDWRKKRKRKSKPCQAGNMQGLCNISDMPWIWKHNFFLIRGKNTLWTMYDVGSVPLLFRVLSKPWHKSWYQQMTGSGCSEWKSWVHLTSVYLIVAHSLSICLLLEVCSRHEKIQHLSGASSSIWKPLSLASLILSSYFDLKQGRVQAHENARSESEGALLWTKALPASEPLRSVEHTTLKTTL